VTRSLRQPGSIYGIIKLTPVIDLKNFRVNKIMSQVVNVDKDDIWRVKFISVSSYILIGNCGD